MDRHDNPSSVTRKKAPVVRPDFEGWDIPPPRTSWWNHPLLTKGGVTALATLALAFFAYLGKQCFADQHLSELGRILCVLGLGVLALAMVAVAGMFLRPEGAHAPHQTPRKRSNQS